MIRNMNVYHDNEQLLDNFYNTLQASKLESLIPDNDNIYEEEGKRFKTAKFSPNGRTSNKRSPSQEDISKTLALLVDYKDASGMMQLG